MQFHLNFRPPEEETNRERAYLNFLSIAEDMSDVQIQDYLYIGTELLTDRIHFRLHSDKFGKHQPKKTIYSKQFYGRPLTDLSQPN